MPPKVRMGLAIVALALVVSTGVQVVLAATGVTTIKVLGNKNFKFTLIDFDVPGHIEVVTFPPTKGNNGMIQVVKTTYLANAQVLPSEGDSIEIQGGVNPYPSGVGVSPSQSGTWIADEANRTWWSIHYGY